MARFQYEWWMVDIRYGTGVVGCIFKGKNKESVIKQIEREVKRTNNLSSDPWGDRIIEVYWDTMKLDRKGYNRLF